MSDIYSEFILLNFLNCLFVCIIIVCGLFNDANKSCYYIASNDLMNNELERMWPNLGYSLGLKLMRNATKILNIAGVLSVI
jgi:hypothetical protein